MFLFTFEFVAKWIEYCVLKASIRVRSCTFELAAIVIDRRVCKAKRESELPGLNLCQNSTYLDYLKLDLVVTVLRAPADCLHDCIDEQPRSLAIHRWRGLPFLVLAVVRAVAVEEVVAEELLDAAFRLNPAKA